MSNYKFASEMRAALLLSKDKQNTARNILAENGYDVKTNDIIILEESIPVIKDDQSKDYGYEQLSKTKQQVSEQLSLFEENELQGETADFGSSAYGREKNEGHGRTGIHLYSNPILRRDVSNYYSNQEWNGKEQSPWTIKNAWDTFGFVDFLGHIITSPKDVAQLFSIYRNPALEYFHIVLLKDGKIVRQLAMSSGVSGLVKVIPSGGMRQLREDLDTSEYDEAYLIHNHPGGNTTPSKPDLKTTCDFIELVFKDRFKGHIILNHKSFMFLQREGNHLVGKKMEYKAHKVPSIKTKKYVIRSVDDAAEIFRLMHNTSKTCALDLDNNLYVRSITPMSLASYSKEEFIEEMKSAYLKTRIIVTEDSKEYFRFKQKVKDEDKPFLDCIYLESNMIKEAMRFDLSYKPYDWQWAEAQKQNNYLWDEKISNHPKQGLLFEMDNTAPEKKLKTKKIKR